MAKAKCVPLLLKDELNLCLTNNVQRLDCKFPDPNAPAAMVEAGTGTTSGDEEIHRGLDGAPHLRKGRNDRIKIKGWVVWQASNKMKEGDTITDLADRIKLEADKWGYESERKNRDGNFKLTTANIVKMIPASTTGGRAKNTGKPKK